MHAVRLHVVREACGAADPGDEDDLLARQAELRHEALQSGQDGVVAAAGAPADLLVGLEVLRGELAFHGFDDRREGTLPGMASTRGTCLCRGVRFEVTEPFTNLSYCHCASCKKLSGGAGTANG